MIGWYASGFHIYEDCNIKAYSDSNLGLGEQFELPQGIQKGEA